MQEYSFLRHLADSWGLLAMMLVFVGIFVWAFRPGSRRTHDEIANSIFRNDSKPAEAPKPARLESNLKEA